MQQLTLFEDKNAPPVKYFPNFLSTKKANFLLNHCQALQWEQNYMKVYDKEIPMPRLECALGNPEANYKYSNSVVLQPRAWTEELFQLKQKVEKQSGYEFDLVIGNFYRDGSDSIGWHADKDEVMGELPAIASVSLGACRKFQIRPND
jgi:alkylated DNA repair dioxygenase AlkB